MSQTYQIILLPEMEVAERHLTLREASAWIRAYNETISESLPDRQAVIAEEPKR